MERRLELARTRKIKIWVSNVIDIEEKLKISVCFVFYFEEKLKIGVYTVFFNSKQCLKIRGPVSDIVF